MALIFLNMLVYLVEIRGGVVGQWRKCQWVLRFSLDRGVDFFQSKDRIIYFLQSAVGGGRCQRPAGTSTISFFDVHKITISTPMQRMCR
mmetsp:Transcript_38336/g.80670  ORF Transcript_38336/g.80670 Transcript_38336/m.80670 type:complete len:89 (-) Transcript_38336:117-383(-)